MSEEFEGTPGPWVVHQPPNAPFEYGHHVTTSDGLTVCKVSYQLPSATPAGVRESERIANAELIAEAGTVLHETGLTPRQLAEQRAALLEACKSLYDELLRDHYGEGYEPDADEPMGVARAAIALAQGDAA